MRQRTRKFIGIILTLVWLFVYVLVAMAVGVAIFGGRFGGFAQLAFYIVAGLGWLPVVMLIIKWMARPDSEAG